MHLAKLPFWLRKRTSIAFAVPYIALAIGLMILWRLDIALNGFRPKITKSHYTWTYGPTAFLIVVVGLRRHAKVVQAWAVMQSGPESAGKTLLLDYVSPI